MAFWDVLITGTVVDGSGGPRYEGFVAVQGDSIAAVGKGRPPADRGASVVIDAGGMVVAPGFIDIHSHGDATLLAFPSGASAIGQGVTTIVGGNCGVSPAPLGENWLFSWWEFDWWHRVAPYKYYEPALCPLERARPWLERHYGPGFGWRSLAEFLKAVDNARPAVNFVPLVGHGALRACVMGRDFARRASPDEVRRMEDLLRQGLEEGAWGMSTGRDYEPGSHAAAEEIASLAGVVAEAGGIYATHCRGMGAGSCGLRPNPVDGLAEAVEVGLRSGARVQVSHLLPAYSIHPPPPAALSRTAAEATLEILEDALGRGVDVAFDVVPGGDPGGVVVVPYLASMLAPWLRDAGSPERLAELLLRPDYRQEIRELVDGGRWRYLGPAAGPDWADLLEVEVAEGLDGGTERLSAVARRRRADPLETLFDLVCRCPRLGVKRRWPGREEAFTVFLSHPSSMVASDAFVVDGDWKVEAPPYYLPHPNTFGAFPSYLGRAPGLEEAVARITSRPARALGLSGRGLLRPGGFADAVVLDPAGLGAGGGSLEPPRAQQGIRWVLVNGGIVVADGVATGLRPGRVLRRRPEGRSWR
ncbi:MAG: amidohydrolase family protein [Acetobacteraceae bacterium]|nr:amidohydrolase family protein [Acetobacteraceae bacterium]